MEDRENDRNDKMNEGYGGLGRGVWRDETRGGNGGQRPGSSLLSHHILASHSPFLLRSVSLRAPRSGRKGG